MADTMRTLVSGVIVFLLPFLSACGGGSTTNSTPPPPPPPPPPATISANVAVQSTTNGSFNLAMSTAFQPAEWDYQFFTDVPSAITPLANLHPSHIRLQTVSQGVPQRSASTWDFSVLDAIAQPVLSVGDHSPEMQLGWAPSFMWSGGGTSGTLDANAFSAYAQNMVRYYNTGGFTSSDNVFHQSPSYPNGNVTWWGILNEPSINGFSPSTGAADYTAVYNQVVPAMQAVDGSLRFAALELCCGTESWVQTFASNVKARVDVLATHYYSSCNQRDSDTQLFSTVPSFASSVQQIYTNLSLNPALANVAVWITENNVNADFSDGTGHSTCNPNQVFVTDRRGSSAFFAAWRPYVFSQVGQAGAQLLHHWDFNADPQFGELNWSGNQAPLQLSYWVDYWLARYFPGGSGQHLLKFTNSNNPQVEVLPVVSTDGSVVIMVSNHAVASATDNNGKGLTANVSLDISGLGTFTSATSLVMDLTTDLANGPTANPITVTSPLQLTMNGYSVEFIKLLP